MSNNQVQFTWHAMERVAADGRLGKLTSYAQVLHVLANKPLRDGMQTVVITTLDKVARVQDPTLLNGYAQGKVIVAEVAVKSGNEVTVKTVELVDTVSKYR